MKLAYFPGCSLHSSGRDYDRSIRMVLSRLGVELEEIPDWNCCGATSAHAMDENLAILLPARNLAIAEEMGFNILAPCSACHQRLVIAEEELKKDRWKKALKKTTGKEYTGKVHTWSILEVLVREIGLDSIKKEIKSPLKGYRVISYYGCLIVRIPRVETFDDRENPTSMDRLVELTGAEAVDWPYKTDCCGAGFGITEEVFFRKLSGNLVEKAREFGGEIILTVCPFCQLNLEMYGYKEAKEKPGKVPVPVMSITQWLGLAMGFSAGKMGLKNLLVKPTRFGELVKR
ncbi:MAG: CoB--CoM heterodisulfide reductase iron-sulfur subunit B family protein [Candidatus Eremiobacteraeota bacterium]|nr:CoB--CoM heterodisulfide reductase iron-sulfur subunit B family protein [Candidatus Eremiobacteraeota bacterium]